MDGSPRMTLADTAGPSLRTPLVSCDEAEAAISRYATMPLERVNAELSRQGIDPQPTVAAVLAVVVAVRANRRGLHVRAVNSKLQRWLTGVMRVTHAATAKLILVAVGEMRRTIEGIVRPWKIGLAMPVRVLN